MDLVVERPGALDVHKASVTAAVRLPAKGRRRREEHVAQLKTTVQGLLALADWLAAHRVAHVAMEATGVYWRPVWAVLEDRFELLGMERPRPRRRHARSTRRAADAGRSRARVRRRRRDHPRLDCATITAAWPAAHPRPAGRPSARGHSGERDRSSHDHVARQSSDRDGRRCLQPLVTSQRARVELLAHGELDLALRGHAELLKESPHRHIESLFVHVASSLRLAFAPPAARWPTICLKGSSISVQ